MENGSQKKLVDLRVVDLRNELEKRDLDKHGVKAVLLERLQKAVQDEGHDPETYLFEVSGSAKPSKKDKGDEEEEYLDLDDDQDEEKVGEVSENAIDQDGIDDSRASDLEVMDTQETGESMNRSSQAEKDSLPVKTDGVSLKKEDATGQATPTAPSAASKETGVEAGARDAKMKEEDVSLVVHVDESEENLDYDLDKKGAEAMVSEARRDAPTPTKDENSDNADSKTDHAASSVGKDSTAAHDAMEADAKTPKSGGLDAKKTPSVKKDSQDASAIKNLWISGLSSNTKATDLKAAFSKHGKVVGAKVVTNAKKPGARCYGFVIMSSAEEASKCIQHLNKTELHGRVISIEKTKNDPAAQAREATKRAAGATPVAAKTSKPALGSTPITSVAEKKEKEEPKKDLRKGEKAVDKKDKGVDDKKEPKTADAKADVLKKTDVKPGEKKEESKDEKRPDGAAVAAKKEDVKPVQKEDAKPVKKEDAKPVNKPEETKEQKLKRQEMALREDDRRRRLMLLREQRRLNADSRRVRDDQIRVEREKERIRMEREKLQMEREEVIRLEREKQRFERELAMLREKCDREREELKRLEQTRIEEQRKAQKRTYDSRTGPREEQSYWNEPKRQATEDRFGGPTAERYTRPEDERSFSTERRVVDRFDRQTVDDVSQASQRKETLPMRDRERRIVEDRDRQGAMDRFAPRRTDDAFGGPTTRIDRRVAASVQEPAHAPVDRNEYADRRQAPRDRGDRAEWKETAERGNISGHRDSGSTRTSQWPSDNRSNKNWPQSGSGDRSWSAGNGLAPSTGLAGDVMHGSSHLYSGASAQAANMVMNASRGQDRYSGSGSGSFTGRRY